MKVEIKNFKSIKKVEIDLATINVLIGPPNSGKSNFLESLYLYGIKRRLEYFYEKTGMEYNDLKFIRGFEYPLSFFRDFDFKNIIKINIENYEELNISLERDQLIFNDKDIYSLDIQTPLILLYRYENFLLYGEKDWKFPDYLLPGFENLNYIIAEKYENVGQNLIKRFNDTLSNFYLELRIEKEREGKKFKIKDILSNYVYDLTTIYDIAQSVQYLILFSSAVLFGEVFSETGENIIILLEEPDAHMYPILIEEFIDLLKDISSAYIILTTHNEHTLLTLIDKIPKDKIKVFGVIRGKEGYTEIYELDIEKLRDFVIKKEAEVIRNLHYFIDKLKT